MNKTANYKRGGYDKVISDMRSLLFYARKAEKALLQTSHFEVRADLQKAIEQAEKSTY
jgi:hypothetical protein